MRLLMLFGGGVGCLIFGLVMSMATGDFVLLALEVYPVLRTFDFLNLKVKIPSNGHI
jgi:hypothetical protein